MIPKHFFWLNKFFSQYFTSVAKRNQNKYYKYKGTVRPKKRNNRTVAITHTPIYCETNLLMKY